MKDGYVFTGDDGNKFLVRCPQCYKENYHPAVASGQCVWCGYDANKEAS